MTRLVRGLADLASGYKVILSDVWGVVHNGLVAFERATEALGRFRAGGGTVVLMTNSPNPSRIVATQLVAREGEDLRNDVIHLELRHLGPRLPGQGAVVPGSPGAPRLTASSGVMRKFSGGSPCLARLTKRRAGGVSPLMPRSVFEPFIKGLTPPARQALT